MWPISGGRRQFLLVPFRVRSPKLGMIATIFDVIVAWSSIESSLPVAATRGRSGGRASSHSRRPRRHWQARFLGIAPRPHRRGSDVARNGVPPDTCPPRSMPPTRRHRNPAKIKRLESFRRPDLMLYPCTGIGPTSLLGIIPPLLNSKRMEFIGPNLPVCKHFGVRAGSGKPRRISLLGSESPARSQQAARPGAATIVRVITGQS